MTATSSSSTNPHNWESVLNGHPIFDPSAGSSGDKNSSRADSTSLELSINSLSEFKSSDAVQDGDIPNGRRQTMLIKDADLVVAVGKQVRMTSLTESQLGTAGEQTFKVGGRTYGRIRVPHPLHTALDVVHAKPAIRNPRARVKPEWTSSRGSRRVPDHGNCAAAPGVHETRATGGRLQVRPRVRTHLMLVDKDWEDLCRSVSSTTLLVLRHKLPRPIGTHGVRVALPSL